MAATIIIVGSLNIDLVTETRRLPNFGKTITSKSFQTFPDGKGANQVIAACRLSRAGPPSIEKDARGGEIGESGIRVMMIGAVGNNQFWPRLKGVLEVDGVDVTQVEVKNGVTTGVVVIIFRSTYYKLGTMYNEVKGIYGYLDSKYTWRMGGQKFAGELWGSSLGF